MRDNKVFHDSERAAMMVIASAILCSGPRGKPLMECIKDAKTLIEEVEKIELPRINKEREEEEARYQRVPPAPPFPPGVVEKG